MIKKPIFKIFSFSSILIPPIRVRSKSILNKLSLLSILFSLLIFGFFCPKIFAADVLYFSVQGLKLNMHLDEVIKLYQVNNVKSSKDKYGIINGYEIVQAKGDMKIVINFTGEKRLYRVDFTNQYATYQKNSMGIFELLKRKYGDPTFETIEVLNGESRNIRACWGTTCNRFSPSTPALKSTIEYETGRLKLTLVDNRIFNIDWKKYKDSQNDAKSGRKPITVNPEVEPQL